MKEKAALLQDIADKLTAKDDALQEKAEEKEKI